jgi:alkylhydroperoxidase family enzyme
MSVRSAVALDEGIDEEMLDAVDQYEQSEFSPAQKAALRLADAYLTAPAEMTDFVKEDVAAHLSPTQAVELVVKLMGFSSDKVMIALGLDMDEIRIFTM